MNRLTTTLLITGLTFSVASFAGFRKDHPRRAEVNKRLRNQDERIEKGVKNGKLTPEQATQLHADDAKIKAEERADVKANGGHLTKEQKKGLNQELNAESKIIHDEKHPN